MGNQCLSEPCAFPGESCGFRASGALWPFRDVRINVHPDDLSCAALLAPGIYLHLSVWTVSRIRDTQVFVFWLF